MITSFFAPKSKAGSKRPRKDENVASDASTKRRGVVTPADSIVSSASAISSSSKSSASSLTDETDTLLSFINQHEGEGPSWFGSLEKHFASSNFASLAKFIEKERASKTVYPPPNLTFAALNLTPLHKVKVVVVGQDPYHQPNQGHGLSFSVPHGIKIPPSLRNIYKELHNDKEVKSFTAIPQHGNLERWAKQGVLLLNNVLTVRRGEAASHKKKGWENFTDRVIASVVERDAEERDIDTEEEDDDSEKGTGVVFLLWGKPASAKATTVLAKYSNNKRSKHAVIMCSHPSPLGATKTNSPFMGSKCFSRANDELVKRGWAPIDWGVDGPLDDEDLKKKSSGKKEAKKSQGKSPEGEEGEEGDHDC